MNKKCELSDLKVSSYNPFLNHSSEKIKGVLAKTKDVHIYWVNKEIFNTGVFEPIYIMCTEQESTS